MLLDKNIIGRINSDIYEHCHSKTMSLLETRELNKTQQQSVQYLRNLLNEIDLITKSAITIKITFIERVIQLFLLSLTGDFPASIYSK